MSHQPGLFEQPGAPKRQKPAPGEVRPSWDSPLLQAPVLPTDIRLGTSSWFFPGWRGLVYEGVHPQTALSKKGLGAYAQIPLLRTVSLDRTFYAPITTVEYARYAAQVPDHFSFVVKAPALVCDAVMRDESGRGKVPIRISWIPASRRANSSCRASRGWGRRRGRWCSRSRRCRAGLSRTRRC